MAHLFHHKDKEELEPQYAEDGSVIVQPEDGVSKARHEMKQDKRHEHIGEGIGLGAAAGALYEKHEAKKDPEHARRHKIEEELAATGAVGAGGYGLHEHHEKKDAKEAAEGEKKHHLL
ncbi:hypothetical protein O6H91_10G034500 [Diphasiastrum complanatum]|uniref:Uncharacterized protein n=1 Tax=Diphasiastrum complanatum TaxID=34168 RepID=A0ACC2CFR0_DIPCM|nr:hypothetical protein O6H91_10G034500 [Diphasiastrum complanatum]